MFQSFRIDKIPRDTPNEEMELKYDSKLRRASFLEWISQLEVVIPSNLYTKEILPRYLATNKIYISEWETPSLL